MTNQLNDKIKEILKDHIQAKTPEDIEFFENRTAQKIEALMEEDSIIDLYHQKIVPKDSKGMWRGKPIEEYTHTELIEIIEELNDKYSKLLKEKSRTH